jgi:anti-sigma28 factor (negative regulator of flagellin synthesis)
VISDAGKELVKSDLTPERIEEIRNRINSNYYKSDIVQSKVADKLLNEITK